MPQGAATADDEEAAETRSLRKLLVWSVFKGVETGHLTRSGMKLKSLRQRPGGGYCRVSGLPVPGPPGGLDPQKD